MFVPTLSPAPIEHVFFISSCHLLVLERLRSDGAELQVRCPRAAIGGLVGLSRGGVGGSTTKQNPSCLEAFLQQSLGPRKLGTHRPGYLLKLDRIQRVGSAVTTMAIREDIPVRTALRPVAQACSPRAQVDLREPICSPIRSKIEVSWRFPEDNFVAWP